MIQIHRYYPGVPTTADLVIARPVYMPHSPALLDDNLVLTRYIPEWKLRDLIGSETLYFTRLTSLRDLDPDEARISTAHYLADVKFNEEDGINTPAQRAAYRQFLESGPHQQAYVSCWYQGAAESERMWLEYVPDGRGVAIQTTLGKLRAQFNGVPGGPDGIKRGAIKPIIYAGPDVEMAGIEERDDPIAALSYKGTKWSHENELRAIVYYNTYYLTPHLPKDGERLAVPLMEFIDRVIVAPHSSRRFEAHVRRLVAGTALQARTERSALQRPAVWKQIYYRARSRWFLITRSINPSRTRARVTADLDA